MYKIKFDSKQAMKVLNNVVEYSEGFLQETKARQSYVASKLASTSIAAFYDYLDGLARTNPAMLHHVYEWGQVGDPQARLFELKKSIKTNDKVFINADFKQSTSIQDNSNEPFYDKANIMEDGIPVTVNEVNAKALFFEIDGQEFFRLGPIVIENPGGEQVRGSFLRAFEEFYNVYFDNVYLRAIRFYDHFRQSKEYENNFSSAVKGSGAKSAGKKSALTWILNAPGDDYE